MPDNDQPMWPDGDEDTSSRGGGATARLPIPKPGQTSTDRLAVPNVTPGPPGSWFKPIVPPDLTWATLTGPGGAVRPDGVPNAVTVWLPLTDATTLNSCIHVVPADRDPGYRTGGGANAFEMGDIRALPAQAGSILCWTQALMHWGSHSSPRAVAPRISIAFEYQRADVPPFRTPLLQPGELPSFEDRLKLICMQILFYAHMYDVPPEMTAIAHQILGTNSAG